MFIRGCQARLNMRLPSLLNNKNFNRDGGFMFSNAWHPVINMLSDQEAGLT
jgi:hypothetical protein